jgi:hypothetical protein
MTATAGRDSATAPAAVIDRDNAAWNEHDLVGTAST